MKTLQNLWWLTLLKGIILLLLAFFVFRHPVNALLGVAIYISISLIFTGILQASIAISGRALSSDWGWTLALGLIDIVFGVVLLNNPALTAASLPFVVGFWIIISGIMSFVDAFQGRKENDSSWGLGMILGVLLILVGYFITSNTLVGMLTIATWMGIGFTLAGILNIIVGIKIKNI